MPTQEGRRARSGRAVLAVIAALASGACGGDEDAIPIVPAAEDTVPSESAADLLAADDARCIVDSVVEQVGEDRLAELGITREMLLGESLGGTLGLGELEDYDFNDDEIRALVDSYVDCLGMQNQLADRIAAELPRDVAECMAREAFDDDMRDVLVPLVLGGATTEEFSRRLEEIFVECGGPTATTTR